MAQKKLFHPRVFDDRKWAEGYYQRNRKNIERVGKRFADYLEKTGFTGGRILDVGCGFAAVPVEIAKRFPETEIIGIDLGEPLLEIGKERIAEAGLEKQISLKKGDAENLAFDTDSFDLVINTFLLHIVEKPKKMLAEIERVAKPEGRIMITDLRNGFLGYFLKKFATAYTLDEAGQVIQNSGIRKGKLSKGFFWTDYFCDSSVMAD